MLTISSGNNILVFKLDVVCIRPEVPQKHTWRTHLLIVSVLTGNRVFGYCGVQLFWQMHVFKINAVCIWRYEYLDFCLNHEQKMCRGFFFLLFVCLISPIEYTQKLKSTIRSHILSGPSTTELSNRNVTWATNAGHICKFKIFSSPITKSKNK